MKFLFELFPIILFFVAYKLADIYTATAVAIVATILQVGWSWFKHRKIQNMQWVSLVLITVFGGATLFLHDEQFIKVKPTILYALFAAILLGSRYLFGKNLIRSAMQAQLSVPSLLWDRLNLAWAIFFIVMALLNQWVATSFATNIWVNFKMFGTLGLMLAFIIAQGFWLGKYLEPTSEEPRQPTPNDSQK